MLRRPERAEPDGVRPTAARRVRSEIPATLTRRPWRPRPDRRRTPRAVLPTARAFQRKTGCPCIVNTSFNLSLGTDRACSHRRPTVLHAVGNGRAGAGERDFLLLKAEQPLGMRLGRGSTDLTDAGQPGGPIPCTTGEPLVAGRDLHARQSDTRVSYAIECRRCPPVRSRRKGRKTRHGRRRLTDRVKEFHEEAPFPNYEDIDNTRALLEKARAGTSAQVAQREQIPYAASVLRGRMRDWAAHLFPGYRAPGGARDRRMLEFPDTRAATQAGARDYARGFRADEPLCARHSRTPSFDVVISNGVLLHHTGDCRAAFRRIGKLSEAEALLVVGLYHAGTGERSVMHYRAGRLLGGCRRWDQCSTRTSEGSRARKIDAWLPRSV